MESRVCGTRRTFALSFLVASISLAAGCGGDSPQGPAAQDPEGGLTQFPLDGWQTFASPTTGWYVIATDTKVRASGAAAVQLHNERATGSLTQEGRILQRVRADTYRGRRVRLTARLRADTLGGFGGGPFLGVYVGPGSPTSYDDFSNRPVLGTRGWQDYEIVMDVPTQAVGLTLGAVLRGVGTLRADDFRLEVVASSVPLTGNHGAPSAGLAPTTFDPTFDHAPGEPINLGFEGATPVPAAASAWLLANATPFATDDPTAPLEDLEPLRSLVGDARIVGFGEASHGTREFFRMKHRALEFLVERMGFTVFAIEASFPEALDVDRYVRTGEGDPAALVRGMHFWTWNTDEVVDLVRWMRAYNAARGAPVLSFVGVDMQFPGAAIDSVVAIVSRLDGARGDAVRADYACLASFRNYGSTPAARPYRAQSPFPCKGPVHNVVPRLDGARGDWSGRIDDGTFALLRQTARLVEQWEESESVGPISRDRAMADNAAWWLDQLPQARMMLWAHNLHVIRAPGRMGNDLLARYGSAYRPIGQLFGTGKVNAAPFGPVQVIAVGPVKANTYESAFSATGQPRLLLDARKIAAGGPNAARLLGPLKLREVDEIYERINDNAAYVATVLPGDFDGLVWFATSTPSAYRR
jgi:erythromycin esterase